MKISEYFTLEEFTYSPTALRKNIDNTPSPAIVNSIILLCTHVLDPLRKKINIHLNISSGYRCEALNALIGGASGSQHSKGQAADITADGIMVEDLFQLIKRSDIKFDQCIQEFDRWVHVSFNPTLAERGQCLRAVKVNGATVYNSA